MAHTGKSHARIRFTILQTPKEPLQELEPEIPFHT